MLRAEADIDLSQLQNACSEGLAALVAAHAAMSAAASSRQQDLQEERPAMPAARGQHSQTRDTLFQTLVDCFSQWLRQGRCDSWSRATPASRALASRGKQC